MRNKPMTLVALMMLIAIAAVIIWNFSSSTEFDEMRIVLLIMGVMFIVGAVSITTDNFWGRRMSEYSVSFGPKNANKQDDNARTAKDVQSSRMVLFLVGGMCLFTGIVGFIV